MGTTNAEGRGVWVYLEHDHGEPHRVGYELLSRGRTLADELREDLVVAALGPRAEAAGQEGVRRGADRALVVDHPLLKEFTPQPYARALELLVQQRNPNIVLFGATPNGRDLAARLAVRLKTGLTANAVRLDVEPKKRLLIAAVPGFGGTILALIRNDRARPQLSTVRPGTFPPAETKSTYSGSVERVDVALHPGDVRGRLLARWKTGDEGPAGAERVVVAGLGTGSNLEPIKRLAEILDARLGVTRPLVDLGLAARTRQVGSTGTALRARLAIVAGASGASHFVSGLRDVDFVIAINKDPAAEIFNHADLCVVADLDELLPALLERLAEPRLVVA